MGSASSQPDELRAHAGLCAQCRCSRRIESERGSVFFMCERSRTDPAFPKYPRLPVQQCAGYTPMND
jgi:hypothetical protein